MRGSRNDYPPSDGLTSNSVSHVNMDVFWSGTDMDTIAKISEGGWFTATVFNKRYEMRSALNMNTPVPIGFIDNIPTQALQFLDPELLKKWDEDYEKNVENFVWKGYQGSNWDSGSRGKTGESGGNSERNGGSGTQLSLAEYDYDWRYPRRNVADTRDEEDLNDAIKPMSTEEVEARLERARRAVQKAGPPTLGGKTAGW